MKPKLEKVQVIYYYTSDDFREEQMYVKGTQHLDNIYHVNEANPLVARKLWNKPTIEIELLSFEKIWTMTRNI